MSMADCPKCWDNPCTCGFEYRNMSKRARLSMAAKVLGIGVKRLTDIVGIVVPENHRMKNQNVSTSLGVELSRELRQKQRDTMRSLKEKKS